MPDIDFEQCPLWGVANKIWWRNPEGESLGSFVTLMSLSLYSGVISTENNTSEHMPHFIILLYDQRQHSFSIIHLSVTFNTMCMHRQVLVDQNGEKCLVKESESVCNNNASSHSCLTVVGFGGPSGLRGHWGEGEECPSPAREGQGRLQLHNSLGCPFPAPSDVGHKDRNISRL